MPIAPFPVDVLRFVAGHGAETVLVTLVQIEGSASRAVGTQLAVAHDGSHCGSMSGGCIDAAIVAEALEVLALGQGRMVRFGAGSPYLDLKLPCGGGMDLLFTPRPDPLTIAAALHCLDQRRGFAMAIAADGISAAQPGQASAHFVQSYAPPLRLILIGQGSELAALARLAAGFGADVVAVLPQAQLQDLPVAVLPVKSREALPALASDPWSAIVFLFHDRDWEEFLLPQALALDGFYHGAIGSPATQAQRRQRLVAGGVPPADLAKLCAHVGLIPSTRDPATLALSLLAEVVADYAALVARPQPVR
jgi:xanthine dehydrogenase accessory factor